MESTMIILKAVEIYRKSKHNGAEKETEYPIGIKFNPQDFKKAVREVGGHYQKMHPGREINLIMCDEGEY